MKIKSLISALFFLLPIAAHASLEGGSVGNGGGAWVCREPSGEIRWAKSVDLFEAKNELGLTMGRYTGNYEAIVDQLKIRLQATNADFFARVAQQLNNINYLKSNPPAVVYTDATLDLIDDVFHRIHPNVSDCLGGQLVTDPRSGSKVIPYEQLVNYQDNDEGVNDGNAHILLQSVIWAHLSDFDKAAVVFHEAIYKLLREQYGNTDSVFARQLTGLLFSTTSTADLEQKIEIILGSCNSAPEREAKGDVFTLQSGIYVDSRFKFDNLPSNGICAVDIIVDKASGTVHLLELPFFSTGSCEELSGGDIGACADGLRCHPALRIVSPTSFMWTGFGSPGVLMMPLSLPSPSMRLRPGNAWNLKFDSENAPGKLKILQSLADGGWQIEISGSAFKPVGDPDNGYETAGNGLLNPVQMELRPAPESSNLLESTQTVNIRLPNGKTCPTSVVYQILLNSNGGPDASVEIFWPEINSGWKTGPTWKGTCVDLEMTRFSQKIEAQ